MDDSDIYSCSWGPPDDGKSFGGLSANVFRTILTKISFGRQGRGSIYVVAAGNGGLSNDHCGADGFATNPFMISIGAISHLDRSPSYAEKCPAMNIVTYSSENIFPTVQIKKKSIYFSGITTSDKIDGCTREHGGTSAAAPIVSGAIALLLSQRQDLSWRDVQNILITSAVSLNTRKEHSDLTGFGKLDVEKLLAVGIPWKLVNSPIFSIFSCSSVQRESNESILYFFFIEENLFIERALVKINLNFIKRGDLEFSLISPIGTESFLLRKRLLDVNVPRGNLIDIFDSSLYGWVFTSLAFFHESAFGLWTIRISSSTMRNLSDTFFDPSGIELAFISESEFSSHSIEDKIQFANSVFSFYFPEEKSGISNFSEREWIVPSFPFVIVLFLLCILTLLLAYSQ